MIVEIRGVFFFFSFFSPLSLVSTELQRVNQKYDVYLFVTAYLAITAIIRRNPVTQSEWFDLGRRLCCDILVREGSSQPASTDSNTDNMEFCATGSG